jgi:4-hydroxy-tetrahydrodipicolinate reductase
VYSKIVISNYVREKAATMHSIKVVINGASGKMGCTTITAIEKTKDMQLTAKLSSQDNLKEYLNSHANEIDVVIDFTIAGLGCHNARLILDAGVRPVIGTSGFKPNEIEQLQRLAAERKLGGIIAPNFSIGAVLMIHCAKIAHKFLPHVEIVEMHHEKKADAPSGTAIKTAHELQHAKLAATNNDFAARGLIENQIPIHSIRLPGFMASQEVILSDQDELLTIRHDSRDRNCFMPGVLLACRRVMQLEHLVYGLEQLRDL